MTDVAISRSARLRQELGYPVLDGDGHIVEFIPVFLDYVRDAGHGAILERGMFVRDRAIEDMTMQERRDGGILPHSWHVPAKTEYFATVTSPKRYHDRLGEAGIDFAVLYPTMGIALLQIDDEEQRVTLTRLYRKYMAEEYRPYQDTFTVALPVPMHTPEEAIAGLEHAKALGAKVALMPSHVHRGLPGPDEFSGIRNSEWETRGWLDTFGLDSAYDYDPVWAKAIDLGLTLAAHTAGIGNSDRASISNFVYNQVGHFAAAGAALAKSLFLGGVTARFPDLRVAILEGGVAPGVETFIGLVATWKKRGGEAIKALNPENLDKDLLMKLLVESDPRLARYSADQLAGGGGRSGMSRPKDDFEATQVGSVEDIRDQFCRSFAWGCEADDPLVGLAFDSRVTPLGARVPAFFASDLGHWDVPDFDEPLEEAYELLERGILDADELRDFLFVNPVRFYGASNPDFFTGTTIEEEARSVLAAERTAT